MRKWLSFGVALLVILFACGQKKGALMLSVTTDMKVPKDVTSISLTISVDNALKYNFLGRVTPTGEVILPATLAVAEGDEGASIRIRAMAFQDRKPRVLRDVRTTVPHARVALVRIPLAYVDDGTAVGMLPADPGTAEFDPTVFASTCPGFDQTSIQGECKDSYVDSATLPDFDPALVGDGLAGCFDPALCFAGAQPTTVGADCSFVLGEGDVTRTNVAVVTQDTGACLSEGQCFVPLDASAYAVDGNRATLLPGYCRLINGKSLRLFVAHGACPTKEERVPVCVPPPAMGAAGCEGPVGAQVNAASAAVTARGTALLQRTRTLCASVAARYGSPVPDGADADAACKGAKASLVAAGKTVEVQSSGNCLVPIAPAQTCATACSGRACDAHATPPRCTGGSLEITCRGSCSPMPASPTVLCRDGQCQGSCTPGSDPCRCDGRCAASADKPAICDGQCDADYDPLGCRGGRLELGCQVDAICASACVASAETTVTDCGNAIVRVAPTNEVDTDLAELATIVVEIKSYAGDFMSFGANAAGFGCTPPDTKQLDQARVLAALVTGL